MKSTKKNNKKTSSNNKTIRLIKLVLVSVLAIGLIVITVFTTKQYLAYRSLSNRMDEVAKLLEQNGIDNISKKDECAAIKLGTPISCNLSIEGVSTHPSQDEALKELSTSVEVINQARFDGIFIEDSNSDGIVVMAYDSSGTCSSGVFVQPAENGGYINNAFTSCGYKAWWKQIL